jgi:hypothetical protein
MQKKRKKEKIYSYQFNISQLYFIIFCNIFYPISVPLSSSQKTKVIIFLY